MGPELLLAEIALRAKGKPENACAGSNRLHRLAVGRIHTTVVNQPGDDINLLNLRAQSQAANEIKNVERLTTGISIPAQLKIAGSKQAMEMEVKQTHSRFQASTNGATSQRCRIWCLGGFHQQKQKKRL